MICGLRELAHVPFPRPYRQAITTYNLQFRNKTKLLTSKWQGEADISVNPFMHLLEFIVKSLFEGSSVV